MKRKKREIEEQPSAPHIHPDTLKSVIAILLFGVTIVMLLAGIGDAGPAGEIFYNAFSKLFGWGYYLWPLIALLVAITLLLSQERIFVITTMLGSLGFIAAGLGFIDIIFPERGGLVGSIIGSLETPFGYTAALILTFCAGVATLLIALNAKIILKKSKPGEQREEEIETPLIIKTPRENEQTETPKEEAKPTKPIAKKIEEETKTLDADEVIIAYGSKEKKSGSTNYTPENYNAPPLSLFQTAIDRPTSGDIRANANIIKRTLESFGIHVEMGEINIGPKVTRYTLKPAEGIKVSRLMALNQDLALALAAHPIRIEAPIPGKSLVGIEVPNKTAAIVRLGTLLGFQEFIKMSPLTFILGRDVTGELVYGDIEKMPHLLIAGSTGSGKSVAIHSMIVSLLYKNSPETLQLIMIDPKRVELSVYDGIPHLVAPVITQGKKAVGVFRWAIAEMERRYDILQDAGVRDLKSYNKTNVPPLPYLLIIVDELADLMAAYGREVETSVVRLAQMARATGIHLVLSTQRPSVEVITGLIKANITSRMALQVASQIDSRTILDGAGAEKLLGGGDMLFISGELSKPKRIQGAYISEEEVHKVADYILEHNKLTATDTAATANTLHTITQQSGGEVQGTNEKINIPTDFDNFENDDADDELYDEAIKVVIEAKKASASLLQRRLKVGYARAARLLDIMEAKGVIGPGDGAKPREVYIEPTAQALIAEGFGAEDETNSRQQF